MDKSYLKMNGELYDMLSDSIEFIFNDNPIGLHIVDKSDYGRPDIISLKYYKDIQYWWAILKANNIRYSFRASLVLRKPKFDQPDKFLVSDLYPGKKLLIPTISDITTHLNTVKGI